MNDTRTPYEQSAQAAHLLLNEHKTFDDERFRAADQKFETVQRDIQAMQASIDKQLSYGTAEMKQLGGRIDKIMWGWIATSTSLVLAVGALLIQLSQ